MKTPNIRNILVPIDFSRMSIEVIETAKTFAKRFGAAIHVAHVRQFYFPAGFNAPVPPVVPFSTYTYDEEAEKRATRDLIRLARKHELSGANTHLLTGAPSFDEICRLAKDLPADLIMMPTHGRTGLKHVFLGSTAERMVQHSPCPVFVVRQKRRRSDNGSSARSNTILVPIDFSRRSLAGLKYAIGFAQKTGAKIILLHVVAYTYATNGWVTYELTEVTRAAEKEAAQQMKKLVRAVKFGDIQFETAIATGNAVDRICDYAREHDVDLIVTSTHGRTGLEHVLIGSVAENVVRRAPCSVVAVPSFPARRTVKRAPSLRADSPRTLQRKSTMPPRLLIEREKLTRKYRKLTTHAFAERRKTNRFREGHLLK